MLICSRNDDSTAVNNCAASACDDEAAEDRDEDADDARAEAGRAAGVLCGAEGARRGGVIGVQLLLRAGARGVGDDDDSCAAALDSSTKRGMRSVPDAETR
jgi:hypothetical protein